MQADGVECGTQEWGSEFSGARGVWFSIGDYGEVTVYAGECELGHLGMY